MYNIFICTQKFNITNTNVRITHTSFWQRSYSIDLQTLSVFCLHYCYYEYLYYQKSWRWGFLFTQNVVIIDRFNVSSVNIMFHQSNSVTHVGSCKHSQKHYKNPSCGLVPTCNLNIYIQIVNVYNHQRTLQLEFVVSFCFLNIFVRVLICKWEASTYSTLEEALYKVHAREPMSRRFCITSHWGDVGDTDSRVHSGSAWTQRSDVKADKVSQGWLH